MYIIIHLFIRENYGSVVYKGKAFVISIPFIFELHSFLIQITQIGFPSQILFSPSHLFFQFNNRLPLSSHSLCPSPLRSLCLGLPLFINIAESGFWNNKNYFWVPIAILGHYFAHSKLLVHLSQDRILILFFRKTDTNCEFINSLWIDNSYIGIETVTFVLLI